VEACAYFIVATTIVGLFALNPRSYGSYAQVSCRFLARGRDSQISDAVDPFQGRYEAGTSEVLAIGRVPLTGRGMMRCF